MSKYAVYVAVTNPELISSMAKSFYYKSKVQDLDMYFIVEDRVNTSVDAVKKAVKVGNNPNMTSAKVISATEMNKTLISMKGSKFKGNGKDHLMLNTKSNFYAPGIVLLNKGYDNVMQAEEDFLFIGPFMELMRSNHAMAQALGWPSSCLNAKSHNAEGSIYSEIDKDCGTVGSSDEKITKDCLLQRAPYMFNKQMASILEEVYFKYLNNDVIMKRWAHYLPKSGMNVSKSTLELCAKYDDKTEKSRFDMTLPGDLWEDSVKLSHVMFYKALKTKSVSRIIPIYNKMAKETARNDKASVALLEKFIGKTYILHCALADKKTEMPKIVKILNDMGYKGEYSPEKFDIKRNMAFQGTPAWLKIQLAKGIGNEWIEIYRTGSWLKKD